MRTRRKLRGAKTPAPVSREPKDIIICRGCGERSGRIGDRFRGFLWPHWKSCRWRGFTHDFSKFLPSEFFPYAHFFYGAQAKKRRDETGYYKPTDTGDKASDFAWLLHQKRNKHHWQWWILPEDEGGVKVFEMPLDYRREMLADWRGAGRAQGTPDVGKWYEKNKGQMKLGPVTRAWIESQILSHP